MSVRGRTTVNQPPRLAHAEGKTLETAHVLAELGATRPLAVVRAEKVQALRLWASERTVPTD